MADPFANLLTSLKEEKKTNKNEVGNQVTNTLNADLNNNDLLQSNSKPLVVPSHEINMNDSIHNDLDDLFGFSSQSNTPAPIPQRQPVNGSTANNDDDDFMSVFDNFDSKEQSTQQYISENPLPSSSNENVSVVVDEIKDMEVAQLMSLGMSIDKANKYYNKGVLYDDIIKNRKLKRLQLVVPAAKVPV